MIAVIAVTVPSLARGLWFVALVVLILEAVRRRRSASVVRRITTTDGRRSGWARSGAVVRGLDERVDQVVLALLGLLRVGGRAGSPSSRSVPTRTSRRRGALLFAVTTATAVTWFGGALAAVAAVVVLGVGLALVSAMVRGRAERTVDEALPVVVDRVAVAVRAGLSVADGLRDGMQVVAGPVHTDLHRVVSAVSAGAPLGRALAEWRRRRPSRGVRLVVAAMTLGLEVGSRSRPLEGVAATLRSDLVAQAEIRGAAAQARAQAAVMIGAPALFVVANVARDPAGFGSTFTRPIGAACLILAVALDGAGAWWMARMMRAAR